MKSSDSLVIIPAYDEVESIGGVIDSVRENASGLDIVVINDGSADGTDAVVTGKDTKVINMPFHMGYGTAIQAGYKYALRKGYDHLVQIDGDGQHEPRHIVDLLRELRASNADVVIGSRFLEKGGQTYRGSFARRIGMVLFGTVASIIMRRRVTDPTSGYIGLNRRAIEYLCRDIYPADYPDADVIIMLHKAGFRIKEVPVVMYENWKRGKLHRGMRPLHYIFKMSLSIFVTALRKE